MNGAFFHANNTWVAKAFQPTSILYTPFYLQAICEDYLNFFVTVSRIGRMIANVDFEFGSAR